MIHGLFKNDVYFVLKRMIRFPLRDNRGMKRCPRPGISPHHPLFIEDANRFAGILLL